MSSQQPTQTDRDPRGSSTREESVRITRDWAPPSLLPDAMPEAGYVLHWKVRAIRGVEDPTLFNKALREGWEPVKLSDHPELKLTIHPLANGQSNDWAEIGGLVLCRMPAEMARQRNAHYAALGKAAATAEANKLANVSDPRMPMYRPKMQSHVDVRFGGQPTPEANE